jgi:VanZ family protein
VFPHNGIVVSDGAPPWLADAIDRSELSVIVEARAAGADQLGPARILTVSGGVDRRNLTLGQSGGDLEIRLRRPGSDANGAPPFRVPGVFDDGDWHRLAVDVADGSLEVAIDDSVALEEELASDPLRGWDRTYRLALGNETDHERPWRGEVRAAEAGPPGSTVDLLADGVLEEPSAWWDVPERVSEHDRDVVPTPLGALLNVLLFVPIGVLVAWAFAPSGRAVATAVVVAAVLSLGSEALQIVFAPRHPSPGDLLPNIVGGALGAWVAQRFAWRWGQ